MGLDGVGVPVAVQIGAGPQLHQERVLDIGDTRAVGHPGDGHRDGRRFEPGDGRPGAVDGVDDQEVFGTLAVELEPAVLGVDGHRQARVGDVLPDGRLRDVVQPELGVAAG